LIAAGAARWHVGPVYSEESGVRGPGILKEGIGVKALSLGNAFVSVADDPSALVWNPAGLAQLPRPEALFQHENGFEGQTTDFVGLVFPAWWLGDRRNWGVYAGLRQDQPFTLIEDGSDSGRATPREGMAGISGATPLGPLNAGVSLKWVFQQNGLDTLSGGALDAGLQGAFHRAKGRWGAALANIGGPLRPEGPPLPMVVRSGIDYTFQAPPAKKGRWMVALEADAPIDETWTLQMGMEYALHLRDENRVALRGGVRAVGSNGNGADASFGLGWENMSWRFNCAFAPLAEVGTRYQVDVAWRFSPPLLEERRRDHLLGEARAFAQQGEWSQSRSRLAEVRALSPSFAPARRLSEEVESNIQQTLRTDELMSSGREAEEAGNLETAALLYQKIILLLPDHEKAKKALAQVEAAWTAQRKSQAQKEITLARSREAERLAQKARLLTERKNWKEALPAWEEVAILNVDLATSGLEETLSLLLISAEQAAESSDWEKAIALYRIAATRRDVTAQLADIEGRLQERNNQRGQALYWEGIKAFRGGDMARARLLFQEAAALIPDSKQLRRALERLEEEERR
jgi:hypothetical protein